MGSSPVAVTGMNAKYSKTNWLQKTIEYKKKKNEEGRTYSNWSMEAVEH